MSSSPMLFSSSVPLFTFGGETVFAGSSQGAGVGSTRLGGAVLITGGPA